MLRKTCGDRSSPHLGSCGFSKDASSFSSFVLTSAPFPSFGGLPALGNYQHLLLGPGPGQEAWENCLQLLFHKTGAGHGALCFEVGLSKEVGE